MSTLQELADRLEERQTTESLNARLALYHWEWEPERLSLTYSKDGIEYWVTLVDMRTPADVLDWIMQLCEKTWLSHQDLGAFVYAVNELLRPQMTLCSGGQDHGPIDVARQIPSGYLD